MKKIVSLLTAFLLLVGAAFQASASEDWRDKVESERIAFLTAEMDLTPAEAEAFWPLYNEAKKLKSESFDAAVEAYKALQKAIEKGESEEQVTMCIKKYVRLQNAGARIDREYTEKYLKVLSPEKVAKLLVGEEKFRRQQIHRLHRNKQEAEK